MRRVKTLKEIIEEFDGIIQFLVDNDKIKDSSLQKWENFRDMIVDYHYITETYIDKLHNESHSLVLKHEYLEENIFKLEAICLIHGITNINLYLARSTESLEIDAIDAIENNIVQLPGELWKRLNVSDIQLLLK